MSKNKKATVLSAIVVTSVFMSGCGLLGGEKTEKIDPPKAETYTENASTQVKEITGKSAKEAAAEKGVMTELYLVDKNGYVVPQTFALPKTNSVAKQALEYLVQNGPVSEMLPNGFAPVLPADTQMSVNIKDKTAVVDFSKEFKNYKPEDEMKILQAVTWTLTQFNSVDKVKLQLNGHELTEMPVNGTPIGEGLSRANGINLDSNEVVDITNSKAVTVYYLAGEEGSYYYVPVTRRVSNEVKDNVTAAVNELIEGPSYASNLVTDFLPQAKLLDKPKVEDGKVTLNFNEAIYGSFEEKKISKQLLDSLVLSLTEQKGIKSVAVTVNGKADNLVSDDGEKLSEPVTRPENVNTGSF